MSVGVEVYRLLPYFLVFMIAAIALSMLRLSRISSRLSTRDFMISRQISASETTSKVFCHYIKNELLAILSQIRGILHKFDKRSIREVLLQIDDPKLLEIMTESRRKMAGHSGE